MTSLGGGPLEWCRSIGLTADFVAQLPAGDDAEFTEDFLQVIFDGVSGDEQPVGDFLVRVAGGGHGCDLGFACGKRRVPGSQRSWACAGGSELAASPAGERDGAH